MNESEAAGIVEQFLEQREARPELSPEDFLAERGMSPAGLLGALHAALQAEAQLLAGAAQHPERIGPYRVLRALGSGGMGVVYEVERDGRSFALKRLHPGLVGGRARARFQREAQILARLDHPGIVKVVEVGALEGEPYLVMELVRGAELERAAADLDLRARLALVVELARSLSVVHAAGLLHRDLKPQNVLVDERGRAILVDFGLGAAEDEVTLTSTGELLGTPRYMAPELALGRAADARTDVWGLGQILYELVTGRPAIAEGSRAVVLRDVARGRVLDPRALRPELASDLRRILLTALAREPRRRFPSAAALADDLARHLRGEPVQARPPGPLARLQDGARRHPGRATGQAALALVLLVLSALFVAQRRTDARERRRLARPLLERAVIAWGQGEREGARRALLEAAYLDDGAATRALAEQLAEEDGRFDASGLASGAELALVIEARELRLAGDLDQAEARLAEFERRAAPSSAAAVERAALLRERGQAASALEHLRRAARLDPGSPDVHRLLADALIESGEIAAGLDQVREAERRSAPVGEVRAVALARGLLRAPRRAELRSDLARRLELDPDATDWRFALAVLQDADHLVGEAAATYTTLLERAGEQPWALAYLAHLHAGADSARCADCRQAFGALPGLVDQARAADLLARAVRADRGRDAGLLSTIVYLTRDHALDEPVAAAMDEVLAGELPPADRARLSDSRAGLRPAH